MSESSIGSILIRPKSIVIGPYDNGASTYTLYGIRNIKWNDVSPWVHTDIPQGPMLHQHLHSPHVEVTMELIDLDKLHTALFTTPIDSSGHVAIDINNNSRKYPITYCRFYFVDHNGDIIEYSVKFLRVETIGVDAIELGRETRFIVKCSCDLVKKES